MINKIKWVIITRLRDDVEASDWGFQRVEEIFHLYKEANNKCIREILQIEDVEGFKASDKSNYDTILTVLNGYSYAALSEIKRKVVRQYFKDRFSDEKDVRVWVHFGGYSLADLNQKTIKEMWKQNKLKHISDEVWPYSYRDVKKGSWSEIISNLRKACKSDNEVDRYEKVGDLQKAWISASTFYQFSRVLENVIATLYPFYIDIKGLLICKKHNREKFTEYHAEVLRAFLRSKDIILECASTIEKTDISAKTNIGSELKKLMEINDNIDIESTFKGFCREFERLSTSLSEEIEKKNETY